MLMTILKVCKLECKKLWRGVLIAVSTVTFTRVDGIMKLHKVYGPLRAMYFVYLLLYFVLMVGVICYATRRKKVATYKQAELLAVVVLFLYGTIKNTTIGGKNIIHLGNRNEKIPPDMIVIYNRRSMS